MGQFDRYCDFTKCDGFLFSTVLKASATPSVRRGAPRQGTRGDAWTIVEYAARSASVFLQGLTGTSLSAPATGTCSIPRALLSALDNLGAPIFLPLVFPHCISKLI